MLFRSDASSGAAPLMETVEGSGGGEDPEAGEDGVPTEEAAGETEDWTPVEEEGAGGCMTVVGGPDERSNAGQCLLSGNTLGPH